MTKLITVGFAIGLVVALALLAYHAVAWVRGAYTDLDADTAAVLVVASTALLLCSLIIASALRSLGQDLIASRKWSAKAGTYERCVELIQDRDREFDIDSDRLASCGLALHAGQNVLRKYRVFREATKGVDWDCSTASADALLEAMRRDLGEATFGLSQGDLASLLIRPRNRGARRESVEVEPQTGQEVDV